MIDHDENLFCFTVHPELNKKPRNQTVLEGSNVTFQCSASGIPEPDFTWFFSGGSLPPHKKNGGTIEVLFVNNTPIYEGHYTCLASSGAGSINSTAQLIVDGNCIERVLLFYICVLVSKT